MSPYLGPVAMGASWRFACVVFAVLIVTVSAQCTSYTTCNSCTMDYTCRWCVSNITASSGSCVASTASCPAQTSWRATNTSQCLCVSGTSCGKCALRRPVCAWDNSTGVCYGVQPVTNPNLNTYNGCWSPNVTSCVINECLSCVASTATSFANNALYQFLSRLLPGVAFDGGGYCAADGTCATSLNKRLCGSVISNAADCYALGSRSIVPLNDIPQSRAIWSTMNTYVAKYDCNARTSVALPYTSNISMVGFQSVGVVSVDTNSTSLYPQYNATLGLTFALFEQPETDDRVLTVQLFDRTDFSSAVVGVIQVSTNQYPITFVPVITSTAVFLLGVLVLCVIRPACTRCGWLVDFPLPSRTDLADAWSALRNGAETCKHFGNCFHSYLQFNWNMLWLCLAGFFPLGVVLMILDAVPISSSFGAAAGIAGFSKYTLGGQKEYAHYFHAPALILALFALVGWGMETRRQNRRLEKDWYHHSAVETDPQSCTVHILNIPNDADHVRLVRELVVLFPEAISITAVLGPDKAFVGQVFVTLSTPISAKDVRARYDTFALAKVGDHALDPLQIPDWFLHKPADADEIYWDNLPNAIWSKTRYIIISLSTFAIAGLFAAINAFVVLVQLFLASPVLQYQLSSTNNIVNGVPSWVQSNIPNIMNAIPPLITAGLNEATGAVLIALLLAEKHYDSRYQKRSFFIKASAITIMNSIIVPLVTIGGFELYLQLNPELFYLYPNFPTAPGPLFSLLCGGIFFNIVIALVLINAGNLMLRPDLLLRMLFKRCCGTHPLRDPLPTYRDSLWLEFNLVMRIDLVLIAVSFGWYFPPLLIVTPACLIFLILFDAAVAKYYYPRDDDPIIYLARTAMDVTVLGFILSFFVCAVLTVLNIFDSSGAVVGSLIPVLGTGVTAAVILLLLLGFVTPMFACCFRYCETPLHVVSDTNKAHAMGFQTVVADNLRLAYRPPAGSLVHVKQLLNLLPGHPYADVEPVVSDIGSTSDSDGGGMGTSVAGAAGVGAPAAGVGVGVAAAAPGVGTGAVGLVVTMAAAGLRAAVNAVTTGAAAAGMAAQSAAAARPLTPSSGLTAAVAAPGTVGDDEPDVVLPGMPSPSDHEADSGSDGQRSHRSVKLDV